MSPEVSDPKEGARRAPRCLLGRSLGNDTLLLLPGSFPQKGVTKPPTLKGRRIRLRVLMGGILKNLWMYFKTEQGI